MHGSNRLGGNSLSDLLVFGRRAGLNATYYAKRNSDKARPRIADEQVKEAAATAVAPFSHEGGENPYDPARPQDVMQRLVGIIRKAEELTESLTEIEQLKQRAKLPRCRGAPPVQPGWHLAIDLANMLLVSECIAKAALERQGVARRPHPRRLSRPGSALGRDQPHPDPRRRPWVGRPQAPAAARHA